MATPSVAPRKRRPRISACCAGCSKEFQVTVSRIEQGRGKFCSKECYYASGGGVAAKSFEERFWSNIDQNGPLVPHRPDLPRCWIWTGSKDAEGYGRFRYRGKIFWASHVSMALHGIPIEDREPACHHCDRPNCVHPEHLYSGSAQSNAQDRESRGRSARNLPPPKLTEQAVLDIRTRYANGEKQRSIAALYGIHQVTVSEIVTLKIWTHV